MKTLNRPMFKNGGPIKEGIMSGMKDNPQQLVQPNADGSRPGYAGPLAALPLIFSGLRAGRMLAPIAKNASFFQRINPMRLMTSGRFRNVDEKFYNPKNMTEGTKMTQKGIFESLKDPKQLGMAIRENPFTALSSLTLPNMAISAAPSIFSGLKSAGKTYIDAVLPGKQFQGDNEIKETPDSKKLEIVPKIKTVANAETGADTKSDEEKAKINEDRINETKQKYYKLMGIDKMNKNAAYNSLIDASKIIQEQGGDLKGAIKSGSLQSSIINAISKNLDKSSALKKQIDAAVLKAEIEKDIKRSDPDAAINREYKQTQIALGKKKLEGPSAADVMSSATIDGKNIVTSNTLTSVLSGMGRDVDFTFPDDKFQKWEKNNEGKDEIDYLTENYGGLDNGTYVVNKKAFKVEDGSVFPIDLDSITG